MKGSIGIFDSGYGGLTVLKSIKNLLPNYDCIYLGDNARAPYGARSFEVVNNYTLEAVEYLFNENCPIVILACNTSSAKALRNIQKNILPIMELISLIEISYCLVIKRLTVLKQVIQKKRVMV